MASRLWQTALQGSLPAPRVSLGVSAFLLGSTSRAFSSTPAAAKPSKLSARSKVTASISDPVDGEKPRRVLSFKTTSGFSSFKTFLPITPSLRQLRQPIAEHLHKGNPLRALTIAKRSTAGRNETGRITTRGRGGGHRRRVRLVDFLRKEPGEQEVVRIEYDPGRSAHIALLRHKQTQDLSYILAPTTLREGDTVQSFRSGIPAEFMTAEDDDASEILSTNPAAPQSVLPTSASLLALISSGSPAAPSPSPPALRAVQTVDLGLLRSVALKPGNCLPIKLIPVGTVIHGITLSPTGPAILARSAGASARIMSSTGGNSAQIRLNSGEVRLVNLECLASIGAVSNQDHQHRNLGKAGRARWLGRMPITRGMAMNATDHPHGGGRGKSQGNRKPTDIYGNLEGRRTRSPASKNGNKMVVKPRPRGPEKKSR